MRSTGGPSGAVSAADLIGSMTDTLHTSVSAAVNYRPSSEAVQAAASQAVAEEEAEVAVGAQASVESANMAMNTVPNTSTITSVDMAVCNCHAHSCSLNNRIIKCR